MEPKEYIRKIATHYQDSDSIKMILGISSIDTLNIDIDGKPLNIWYFALKEAYHQQKLAELIQNVTDQYPALKLTDDELVRLEKFLSGNIPPIPPIPKWIKIAIPLLLLFVILFALKDSIFPRCEKPEVMKSLKGHVNAPIPFQADPDHGTMKIQMLEYLERYSISKNQELLKELKAIKQLVQQKSNPNNPAKYFNADNEFKTRLNHFKNKVQRYTNTCKWN